MHTCKQCNTEMRSRDQETFVQFHERKYIQQNPMRIPFDNTNTIQPLRVADVDAGEFCSRECLRRYLVEHPIPDVDLDNDIPF